MAARYHRFVRNLAAVLVFGRPPLVFAAFGCALWLMFTSFPPAYILGLSFLLLAMAFDWIDGWFAERYIPHSRLGPLVDRMVDRIVLSIIFPVLGAGMFWRYTRLGLSEGTDRPQLLHALFVLSICVIVLMRDQLVQFLRSVARRAGEEPESGELARLRTLVFSPIAVLLYAYAFYQPTSGWEGFYRWVDWVDRIPLRMWFVIEIIFLVINIASITLALRKYGALALEDITEDDEILRRRILAVIPNALTLMNGLLGIVAVVFVSYGRVREAVFTLLGAALLDRLDGLMARRLGLTEPPPGEEPASGVRLGALLDDISDAISFGFAPAMIYFLLMREVAGGVLSGVTVSAVALLYVVGGITRLVYFTIDKHPIPGFFKGLPIPAAALLVASTMEIANSLQAYDSVWFVPWLRVTTGVMLLATVVMNLFFLRYLHIGRLMGRRPVLTRLVAALTLVLVFTPLFGPALLAFMLIYLLSPPFTRHIDPTLAAREERRGHEHG